MFATIDWVIVAVYLALSLAVGLWGKRYLANLSDYLVAGRELGLYIGIATLAATETGTITFMYNGEFGYRYGFAAFAAALISGLTMIFVGRTGFVISRLRQLELMTVPEYFEARYSRGLRLLVGVLVAVGGIFNMGVFLRIEGEFLTTISGFDRRYLIAAMTFILLLELIYTVLGGMISVVITDFLQYVLLAVATLTVSILVVSPRVEQHGRQGRRNHGASGVQPIRQPKVWNYIPDLADAPLAFGYHLLAIDSHARLLDTRSSHFAPRDDLDRLHFPWPRGSTNALGNCCAHRLRHRFAIRGSAAADGRG